MRLTDPDAEPRSADVEEDGVSWVGVTGIVASLAVLAVLFFQIGVSLASG